MTKNWLYTAQLYIYSQKYGNYQNITTTDYRRDGQTDSLVHRGDQQWSLLLSKPAVFNVATSGWPQQYLLELCSEEYIWYI